MSQQTELTNIQERFNAVVSRIKTGEETLYRQVLGALESTESDTVVGAALVLAELKQTSSLGNLLQAFQTENKRIGSAIAFALGELGDARALPWLIAALEHGFVAQFVCEALGKIGGQKAISALIDALDVLPVEAKKSALSALTKLHAQLSQDSKQLLSEKLKFLLKDSDRQVRLSSALLLECGKRV